MARVVLALAGMLVMAHVASAAVPISVPSLTVPNMTTLAKAAEASLRAAATAVVMSKVAMRPFKCPNGKPIVTCLENLCPKDACTSGKLCVPDVCGQCSHRCVDLKMPALNVAMPPLPAANMALALPGALPAKLGKPLCAANQALNLTAIAAAVAAKRPAIACKACPNGTVARWPSVACTLCPPGTYANRAKATCTRCAPGYYSGQFGATACKPCAAGSFAPVGGSLACIKCPLGFGALTSGSAKCVYTGFANL